MMDHILAGSQIRLNYLQDRRALADIDWPVVYEDLAEAGTPLSHWRWCDLDGLTHVVLAIDRVSGRHAGVLGLTERATSLEPWLLIEAALVRPGENGGTLLRSMLAHVIARIVCLDGKPVAIATPRVYEAALRDLSLHIRSAALHPPAGGPEGGPEGGNVIALRTARFAREIGGNRTVLDLRPVSEACLMRDLRSLHGVRAERLKELSRLRPTAKSARSAGATRRPKKATHTGKTG
jgi:hypothetical protein